MSGSCQRLRLPSFSGMSAHGHSSRGNNPHSLHHNQPCTTNTTSNISSPQKRRNSRPSANSSTTSSSNIGGRPQHKSTATDSGGGGSSNGRPFEQHRIIMMGSERVGKTCIVSQFLYDKFTPRYRRTTEDLHRGEYELADGSTLTLDILDTCGAMEFPAMRRLSIQFGDAFLLVYAVDDAATWKEVEELRSIILEKRGNKVPIVVVGNKCDVDVTHRQIERDEAESIARLEWRCGYIECSAKENIGIVEVFKALLKQAKISYNLSPAVRRRRLSLPVVSGATGNSNSGGIGNGSTKTSAVAKYSMKRHSCSVS